jgi:hypothetical protein
METHELQEQTEHAHNHGQKAIGLTMAIVAVLLGTSTMLSHRAHTEEGTLQTKTNDAWNFYQAKHQRAYDFGLHAEWMAVSGHRDIAVKDLRVSVEEECGVPKEENCTSPILKDSQVLQDLAKDKSGASEVEPPESKSSEGAAASEKGKDSKEKTTKKAKPPKEGARKAFEKATDLEKEDELIKNRADRFDLAELFLELSVVLCSVSLLSENKLYWQLSFITSAIGVGIIAWTHFIH